MKLKRKEEESGPPTVVISKSRYRYLLSQVAKYRRLQLLTELDEAGEDFDITDYEQLRDYALRDISPLRRQIVKLEEKKNKEKGVELHRLRGLYHTLLDKHYEYQQDRT